MSPSTDSVIVRAARPSDADAIAHLHTLSWRTTYRGMLSDDFLDSSLSANRQELWASRLRCPARNMRTTVAERAEQIVGFACAFGEEDRTFGTLIDNLHVLPTEKGRGIGKTLMAEVATWCIQAHPNRGFYLLVFEQNIHARTVYERLGGRTLDRTVWTAPDGTAVDEIRYVWNDAKELLVAADARRANPNFLR